MSEPTTEEIIEFLDEEIADVRETIKDDREICEDRNSYGAGYDAGLLGGFLRVRAFIKENIGGSHE